jgi:DNA-binding SARP family transcriptional activator
MLGSFEVRTDDGVLADVPGARLRGLLIALALEPGHAVPKATLVDWIWGERPPSDAANALQRLVSRLRKALPEGLVEGQADGYRLRVEPDAVDAVRFERLVGQARNDEDPRRVRLLREALALWRGAAMQDVGLQDSAAFDAAVTRLEGLRLTAMEDRFDAEISLGHDAELVTELTDLMARWSSQWPRTTTARLSGNYEATCAVNRTDHWARGTCRIAVPRSVPTAARS